jgi:hypothetical protein
MNNNNSYATLMLEKQRLEQLLEHQKAILREDVSDMKKQLAPAYELLNKLGRFTKGAQSVPLLGAGVGLGADLLLGSRLLRKASPIIKYGMPIAVRFIGSGIVKKLLTKVFRRKN